MMLDDKYEDDTELQVDLIKLVEEYDDIFAIETKR